MTAVQRYPAHEPKGIRVCCVGTGAGKHDEAVQVVRPEWGRWSLVRQLPATVLPV